MRCAFWLVSFFLWFSVSPVLAETGLSPSGEAIERVYEFVSDHLIGNVSEIRLDKWEPLNGKMVRYVEEHQTTYSDLQWENSGFEFREIETTRLRTFSGGPADLSRSRLPLEPSRVISRWQVRPGKFSASGILASMSVLEDSTGELILGQLSGVFKLEGRNRLVWRGALGWMPDLLVLLRGKWFGQPMLTIAWTVYDSGRLFRQVERH